MSNCDQLGDLLSGYVDGELTQQERQRVEVHLRSSAECREALNELIRLRGTIGNAMQSEGLSDQRWERIAGESFASGTQQLSWFLIACPLVIATFVGGVLFAWDDEVPVLIKCFVALIAAGLGLLFGIVVRQRWNEYGDDKYRKVKI
ncbi:MAG: zf-HC2 domain-containing protein [Planctomycetota bacterium]